MTDSLWAEQKCPSYRVVRLTEVTFNRYAPSEYWKVSVLERCPSYGVSDLRSLLWFKCSRWNGRSNFARYILILFDVFLLIEVVLFTIFRDIFCAVYTSITNLCTRQNFYPLQVSRLHKCWNFMKERMLKELKDSDSHVMRNRKMGPKNCLPFLSILKLSPVQIRWFL